MGRIEPRSESRLSRAISIIVVSYHASTLMSKVHRIVTSRRGCNGACTACRGVVGCYAACSSIALYSILYGLYIGYIGYVLLPANDLF